MTKRELIAVLEAVPDDATVYVPDRDGDLWPVRQVQRTTYAGPDESLFRTQVWVIE